MSSYAIVGISCLFPDAASPAEFWANLRSGRDSRREGGEPVFGPAPASADVDPAHRIYCTRGGFITDFAFDPAGYQLDAGYLAGLDRVYQWSLYAAREALRDSGYGDRQDVLARTGLVLGNYSFPTPHSARLSVPLVHDAVRDGLVRAGTLPAGGPAADRAAPIPEDAWVSGLPARVAASALGLGGPRYALDAACSSALYALDLACRQLAAGQVDLALAGGVCAPDPTLIHLCFSDLQAYSKDGFSQPFDARSAGILTGQGAGMVAVRRLADAERDGDRILAVVEGIGLSNDGSGRHLLLPNAAGQRRAYELAYADAGVDPAQVSYLECHATGTPAGDATEAESVADFFGGHGRVPLLGSVKGNIGHLLTVAGLSSLIKVILSIQHGIIPPTTGIAAPVSSKDGQVGDAAFVQAERAWPEDGTPRRAAVSAFGFGGANAHVVISGPTDSEPTDSEPTDSERADSGPAAAGPLPLPVLDVVGMGAHFGTLASVPAFSKALFDSVDTFGPLPERRWRGLEDTAGGTLAAAGLTRADLPVGGYVDTVDVDPIDYRLPPADLRNINLQHLLALEVADEALRDAGYRRGGQSAPPARRVAVVIAMEIEPSAHLHLARYGLGPFLRSEFDRMGVVLTDEQRAVVADLARDAVHEPIVANEVLSYIGNIMASRISSLWNLTGPSFTVSSDDAGAVEALQIAQLLLFDPTIEAVLVGAVDLAGSPERLLLRTADGRPATGPGLAFGAGSGGWRVGDGAGAVVVTRAGEPANESRAYGRLESVVVRHSGAAGAALPGADADVLAAVALDALRTAGISAGQVGYVDANATGVASVDAAELSALAAAYPTGGGRTALGAATAQVGDCGAARPMAGLIRALLCLHHGYVPGVPNWTAPAAELTAAMAGSGFHVPTRSQPWLRGAGDQRRHAAVSVLGAGGAHGHVVLSEGDRSAAAAEIDWLGAGGPLILPLGAADDAGLLAAIERCRESLSADVDPAVVARAAARALPGTVRRAVFVGADRAGLLRQLDRAASDLPTVLAAGGEWATPDGSYATGSPIGPDGKVALVYPGAFNSYPGLGQDLFRAFPGLLRRFEAEADEPARMFRADQLYPPTQVTADRRTLMENEARLGEDLPFMLATGTNFALSYTDLLRELLGVGVHGAFGYSLGESSMLFATGGWRRAGRRDDRINATPLFKDLLCGPRRTVRELWNLPADTPDNRVWATYVLLAPVAQVRAALARFDRLFLTHANTPEEVVVGGDPAQLDRLIAELGCRSARSPVNVVMHCSVIDRVRPALAELNDHPVGSAGGLELLSAYDYGPVPELASGQVAARIAHTLRTEIDFPRLVEAAYARGFRYFLEAGPSSTCSRWIRESLGDRPNVAMPVDRRGVPAWKALAPLIARLAAHGVPVDIEALLGPEPAAPSRPRRLQVPAGGGRSIPAGISRGVAAALPESPPVTPAAPRPAPVLVPVAGARSPVPIAVLVVRPMSAPQPVASDAPEESDLMPADPSLADPEVITFDGDPVTALPWAVDATAGAPPAAPARPPRRAARQPVRATGQRRPGQDLVRELRDQMLQTHSMVMETQRILQDHTLATAEALVTGAEPPAWTAPVGPELPPINLTVKATVPARPPAAEPAAVPRRTRPPGVIWDSEDLLEFATGSIASVFGAEFAEIDRYGARVRLPAPPYHFVTRVTDLRAETGKFEPSFIRTEYDVPPDAWYCVDGGVPPAVAIEAGQCDLLLISYLGIDFQNRGQRVYRLLDSTLVFHGDLPRAGQTLRYDISINRFVRQGDTTIFFFSYLCYADGELILELKDACAGFFSPEQLATPLGVVLTPKDKAARAALTKGVFKPLAHTDRTSLAAADLELLAQGRIAEVFGPHHGQDPGVNPAIRLPDAKLRMVDEITRIDRTGGPRGLGAITAVKRLAPDAWYFTCHFPDDPVLAGSMVAEGAVQILQAYLMHQGMHLVLPDARFQTIVGLETDVQVRGQITPQHSEIRYEVEVMELTLLPRPSVIAEVLVYLGDRPVIRMRNFGIQIREKAGTAYRPEQGGIAPFLGRRNRSGEAAMINELHLAHAAKGDLATAMGPEFEVYRASRAPYIPNGAFQFVDRIMSLQGTRGDLSPGSEMVTEYDSPPDAWYYTQNSHPHLPNAVLMETSLQAAILLGYYLGATLKKPEIEYAIRNLDGNATVVKDIDLRGKTIRQRSKLLMTSAISGAVLQRFSYELFADGELFYTGESLFGYFSDAALAKQVGLDNGAYVAPWIEQEKLDPARVRRVELTDGSSPFTDPAGGHLRLPGGNFDLVDHVDVVADGGRYGAGYLHGYRAVRPDEWYFDCHFHRDPVMPGSLGVEAVLQGLRLFAIEQNLAAGLAAPRFALATDTEMKWRYRGQILRHDGELRFDVHVKEVRREAGRVLVVADADVWKPGLRIYELTDVSLEIRPTGI